MIAYKSNFHLDWGLDKVFVEKAKNPFGREIIKFLSDFVSSGE